MKRTQSKQTGWLHGCPVKCPVCSYNKTVWPARFRRFTLEPSQTVGKISRNSNHILLLIDGALHIRMEGRDIYIQSRHAMFFGRDSSPRVQAMKESRIIWLEFTNRIVLGECDVLSRIPGRECREKDEIPVLCLNDRMIMYLRSMLLLDSPCHHLCVQKELYLLLKSTYDDDEVACLFRPLINARKDFQAFIIDNYRYGDTLEEVARKAHMSKSHLLYKFKEEFGVTAYQWILQQKAQKVLEAIAAGETDSNALAQRFRFPSVVALYHFCRRHMGGSFSQITGKYPDKKP